MNWFMLWLDFSAVVGVVIYAIFGVEGLVALQQFLIDRLMRGVHGK